jgi:taurine dioxygenase
MFRTDVWHSDETFRREPPKATILVAKEVPAIGGDTMFVSMSAAFDGLSDRMQHFISGLEAIHDFKPFRELFDDSEEDRKNVSRCEMLYPPAVHPVVRVHPVTGRKVLFVNPQKDSSSRRNSSRCSPTSFFRTPHLPRPRCCNKRAPSPSFS